MPDSKYDITEDDINNATFSAPPSSAPAETYTGSCHCAAFTYNVTQSPPLSDPSAKVTECNCSICRRDGAKWIYVPDDWVKFSKGSFEELKGYTFNTKRMMHYFCGTCGSSCFSRSVDKSFFSGMTCVNVRMFDGVDLTTLGVRYSDGANL